MPAEPATAYTTRTVSAQDEMDESSHGLGQAAPSRFLCCVYPYTSPLVRLA